MTTAEPPAGRLYVDPETVRAGPPGLSVWPGARTKPPPGACVTVEPPTCNVGLGEGKEPAGETWKVEVPPTTRADPNVGRDTGTPLIVVACPGARVIELPITTPPEPGPDPDFSDPDMPEPDPFDPDVPEVGRLAIGRAELPICTL